MGIPKVAIIKGKRGHDPYPQELMDIDTMTAYCNGKDYWKYDARFS